MTLEIHLRRFSFLPGFIQTGNGEPRRAHIVGKNQAQPVGKQDPRHPNDRSPREQNTGRYRPLTSIGLGEVDDALRYFMPQMVPSPLEGWIARDYFCQLPVRQQTEEQSPLVFGRVRSSYPVEGHAQNIDQMEIYFPTLQTEPDLLNIRRSDISWQLPLHSYCVGVKMYLSEAEMDDFSRSENIFIEKGFAPIYETGYLSLLDMTEQDHSNLLWLNVIGSEWFASIPESVQPEIRVRLRDLVSWTPLILNYHPRRYSLRYPPLNDELDFQYGFTRHFLLTPQDTNQVLQKAGEKFDEIFMHAIQ
ncbi:MAG: hypothetical protein ACM3XO_04405 [Bacteroidota bacterium]